MISKGIIGTSIVLKETMEVPAGLLNMFLLSVEYCNHHLIIIWESEFFPGSERVIMHYCEIL